MSWRNLRSAKSKVSPTVFRLTYCALSTVLFLSEGRFSKTLWSKLDETNLPTTMTTLNVLTSETRTHHSWTTDHLLSIPSLPFELLESLSVSRSVHPFDVLENDNAALQSVPQELLKKLKGEASSNIKELNLDWWLWSTSDLKELLANNPQLESLSFTLDAPISKMLSLSNVFANMHNLRTLRVAVPLQHAPGVPTQLYHQSLATHPSDSPLEPHTGLPTPSSSPVTRPARGAARSPSSPVKKMSPITPIHEESPLQTPPETPSDAFSNLSLSVSTLSPIASLSASLPSEFAYQVIPNPSSNDSSFPSTRDLQKFARRCPRLEMFEWYGKNGRGKWVVTREASAESVSNSITAAAAAGTSTIVKLDHTMPCFPSLEILQQAAREKEAETHGWHPSASEREGQDWVGAAGDAWREALEKEKEEAAAAAAALAASQLQAQEEAEANALAAAALAAATAAAMASTTPSKKSRSKGAKLSKIDTAAGPDDKASSPTKSPSARRPSYGAVAGALPSPSRSKNAPSSRRPSQPLSPEDSSARVPRRASHTLSGSIDASSNGGSLANGKRRAQSGPAARDGSLSFPAISGSASQQPKTRQPSSAGRNPARKNNAT